MAHVSWITTVRRLLMLTTVVTMSCALTVPANAQSSAGEAPELTGGLSETVRAFPSLAEFVKAESGETRSLAWRSSTGVSRRAWASSLGDPTVRVDPDGRAFVVEPTLTPEEMQAFTAESMTTTADIPTSDAFALHSNESSTRTIYLDFTGHNLSGTAWYDGWGLNSTTAQFQAFDTDGDPTTFSSEERRIIIDTWANIAEDYAPLDVDVTTEEPASSDLLKSSLGDTAYGVRALITSFANPVAESCGCGGVAYMDVFASSSFYLSPSLSFAGPGFDAKLISDVVSHEVGHNVGLSHDGQSPTTQSQSAYYLGANGWAPIMGAGYYQPLVHFSDGSYPGGNNLEDDYARMNQAGLPSRVDDHGNGVGSATEVAVNSTTVGVIGSPTDVDYFTFVATGPSHIISAVNAAPSGNVDVALSVYDSSGTLLTTTNPLFEETAGWLHPNKGLDASLDMTTTVGSRYYVSIDGVGQGTLYGDFGSTGEYDLDVSQPTLVAGTPTISGTPTYLNNLTGSTGTWPAGTSVSTEWLRDGVATGDTDLTYTILSTDVGKEITLRVIGSKAGFRDTRATSAAVTIGGASLEFSGSNVIAGTGTVGATLTASKGTWPTGTSVDIAWFRDGIATGFTGNGYIVRSGDFGAVITARFTASKTGYETRTVSSAGISISSRGIIAPQRRSVTPSGGTAKVGSTASVSTSWISGTTVTVEWTVDGEIVWVDSLTNSTFTIRPADLGKTVRVTINASRAEYDDYSYSSSWQVIEGTISPAPIPTISGKAIVGRTLTASTGTWMSGVSVTHQWLRNGVGISGATESTYRLTKKDSGKRISVRVTGSRVGYSDAVTTSGQIRVS